MTFTEFQALCIRKKTGDIKLPAVITDYAPLIQESLEYVANKVIPFELKTTDLSKKTLRFLNASTIVRKPIAPINEADEIDIDARLVYAVAYDFLANLATEVKNINRFTAKRDETISTYLWNNFQLLKELES